MPSHDASQLHQLLHTSTPSIVPTRRVLSFAPGSRQFTLRPLLICLAKLADQGFSRTIDKLQPLPRPQSIAPPPLVRKGTWPGVAWTTTDPLGFSPLNLTRSSTERARKKKRVRELSTTRGHRIQAIAAPKNNGAYFGVLSPSEVGTFETI